MNRSPVRPAVAASCFALPALLFLAVCALMGFAPFGDNSILIFDLSDQFVEFLCALKHGDVFFSWNTALGGSYIGTFSYYVSSPFSLLTLLCPDESMPIAVVFLVALKLGLAGFTFSLLLRRRTGRYDLTTAAFSLCYALMSYNIAYAMSFMWLDGVLWLPVLLLGTEDLLDDQRPGVLLIGLTVSFLSTWYISYMTGIFCALYLLWRCLCDGKSPAVCLRRLLQLAGWAALALLLTAWLWLPTALSMFSGKLAQASGSFSLGFNWPLTTLFYKLLVPGAYDSVTYTGSAFLYVSLPASLLAALWFFLPNPRRVKFATLVLTGFLTASLWFTPLDTLWHLFQAPNSFPGRWSFSVSCFLLLLAYDAFLRLSERVTLPRLSAAVPVLLTAILCFDMTVNALLLFRGMDAELGFESYASYHDYKQTLTPLTDRIRSEDSFLRVNSDLQRSRNEAPAFGYKGLTFFSSSYNAAVNDLLNDLGYAQAWFWSTSLGATPVSDLLLGVGWHITDEALPYGYTQELSSGSAALYRNNSSVSPAYFTAGDLSSVNWTADPFQRQNALLSAVSGVENPCFLPLTPAAQESAGSVTWTFLSDGSPVYALFPKAGGSATLYLNGVRTEKLYTNETDCIRSLGSFPAGQTVKVRLDYQGSVGQVRFYTLDADALDTAAAALEANRLQITEHSNGRLSGTVTASEDGMLYTSIPAIPGWTVTVDGADVSCDSFRSTLLTVPLTAGTHTVSMSYSAPGLIPGLLMCGIGLVLLALLLKRRR